MKKKEVYVLFWAAPYEGQILYGVYDSEEKAKKARTKEFGDKAYDYYVSKVELNAEPDYDCTNNEV